METTTETPTPEVPAARPVYEWKAMWMHQEWQAMPHVHDDEAADKFLRSKMPHSEESSIRVDGKNPRRWKSKPSEPVLHGLNCSCCPDWN